MRELARQGELTHSTVSEVIAGNRAPTHDFCVAVARALGEPEADVLWRAGLLEDRPIKPDEPWMEEAIYELRQLTPQQREHALALIKLVKDGALVAYSARRKKK